MEYITLKNKIQIPKLGMGTWYLGEKLSVREEEIRAIRTGIENGMTLIDTAEMYGNGLSEQLVGQAVRGVDRDKLFLVSKVLPQNLKPWMDDHGVALMAYCPLAQAGRLKEELMHDPVLGNLSERRAVHNGRN